EGTTYVSIRSCLQALSPADIQRLTFDGLEELIAPQHLEEMRQRLRAVVALVVQESRRRATMFDVFRLLTDEVQELAAACLERGLVQPKAAALSEDALAGRIKECLRAPLVLLCRSGGEFVRREVRFLPFAGLTAESLRDVDLLSAETAQPMPSPPEPLPFWHAR